MTETPDNKSAEKPRPATDPRTAAAARYLDLWERNLALFAARGPAEMPKQDR